MRVFWTKGYQGASMATLSDAMGLKPGSIYAAFGSKDALFAEVVRAYSDKLRRLAAAAQVDPRELIELWFATHITAALDGAPTDIGRGCLVLNSASELPNLGAAGRAQIEHELETLQAFFTHLITSARHDRHGTVDAATTARLLVAALAGIATLSRAGQGREALEAVAAGALAAV